MTTRNSLHICVLALQTLQMFFNILQHTVLMWIQLTAVALIVNGSNSQSRPNADSRVDCTYLQVVQSAPQMFQLSTEDTLTPRLAFLRDQVGLSAEALAKVLVK